MQLPADACEFPSHRHRIHLIFLDTVQLDKKHAIYRDRHKHRQQRSQHIAVNHQRNPTVHALCRRAHKCCADRRQQEGLDHLLAVTECVVDRDRI